MSHALEVMHRQAPINRGTLRPPVEGHGAKKDISMSMRLTKENYFASSKSQD